MAGAQAARVASLEFFDRRAKQRGLVRQEQVQQPAVRGHHALGFAGRTGGVNHIGQMRLVQRRTPFVVRYRRGLGSRAARQARCVVQAQYLRQIRHIELRRAVGQQHYRPRVVAHQRQAFTRVIQIERHIGRAAGQHAEQRDQRVHRARNADGHHVFSADAAFD